MGHRGDEPIYYSVTSDSETGVKKYICKYCPKDFKELKYIVQHYRYVHLKQRTDSKCRICNENLQRYSKAFHLEEVHGIPAPTCGICGKKFPFTNYLMLHQRNVHMREKNFKCTICSHSFFDNHGLQQHQLKHSEERKYKCQICDKKFTWLKNLRVHERIHTGIKPYTCKICSTGFAENKGLKRHIMKYHHDDKTIL